MTMNQLFSGSALTKKNAKKGIKPLRLKIIRPVYESLEVNDDVAQYLNNSAAITSAEQVYELFAFLRDETKEYFMTLHLDNKNQILCIDLVSVGSLSASIVHPREVFKSVLLSSASSILILHNHPSGNITPSQEDISITHRLQRAGDLLDTTAISSSMQPLNSPRMLFVRPRKLRNMKW